jgi:hypothetical protein
LIPVVVYWPIVLHSEVLEGATTGSSFLLGWKTVLTIGDPLGLLVISAIVTEILNYSLKIVQNGRTHYSIGGGEERAYLVFLSPSLHKLNLQSISIFSLIISPTSCFLI